LDRVAIRPPPPSSGRVGGVDDGVDGLLSDVALDGFDVRHAVTFACFRLHLPGLPTSWHRSQTNPIVKAQTNGPRVRGARGPLAQSGANMPTRDLIERVRKALGDRYTVITAVGRGGNACIFGAYDQAGQKVAIKVLHPE